MTNNYILAGAERQEQLEAAKAAFFASGRQMIQLGDCPALPLPVRSDKIDPETVLVRKRQRPTAAERARLRKMADDL
ncbi:hypothetical protein [Pseudomonas sp. zfem002]|uniref:hypothetical protein n=1 Tax=Pseudomonas sp. zfem002 TaxID=3078197 RepID=UPI0029275599|nr:hypothetical protein [Pseudomonas sp. zfem002]MDU9394576.1 hypothetical protein [Pseudomonas sp. zfem002]